MEGLIHLLTVVGSCAASYTAGEITDKVLEGDLEAILTGLVLSGAIAFFILTNFH